MWHYLRGSVYRRSSQRKPCCLPAQCVAIGLCSCRSALGRRPGLDLHDGLVAVTIAWGAAPWVWSCRGGVCR
jgi:hypothetical protein